MVRKIIGTPQNKNEIFSESNPFTTLDFETLTVTPDRTNVLAAGIRFNDENSRNLIVESLTETCSRLINQFLENVGNNIILRPIKIDSEYDPICDMYIVKLHSNRTVPREYQQFVPSLREIFTTHRSNTVVIPRIASR